MNPTAARIASQCLLLRTRRLSRVVTRIYTERMKHHGLSVAQFTLMAAIGCNPGARSVDLAPRLDLEKSTFSRELAHLIEDGLIRSEPGEGRSQLLFLTPAGEARMHEAEASWAEAQEVAEAELGALGQQLLAFFPAPER